MNISTVEGDLLDQDVADREQDKCLLVFHSSNDESALVKLKEIQVESSEDRQVDQERAANMVSEGGPIY
jgi:hypothetical protein